MKRTLDRLTYANVMATVAVFIALGGVGYAAVKLPKNSVGARQLKKGAVTPAKISAAATKALSGARGPAGSTGPQGPQGLRGEAGPAGPSNAYYVFNNDETTGTKTISLNVPAGNYVASASMYAFNREAKEGRVGCTLTSIADRAHEGSAVANVPKSPAETINSYVQPAAETVFSFGSGGGKIEYECGNFEGTAKVGFYQAHITAVAVGSLTG
jgi:hypothetical protein